MNDLRLQRIQSLQFTDRAAAERLLLSFIRDLFPKLAAIQVELRPQAVSLNSFNGYLTLADGRRLFFKTHVEPNSVIGEYYNAQLLAEAGYPIITPLYASTEYGKQLLIYDLIEAPSLFDLARALERGERHDLEALQAAQNAADSQLLEIYRATLRPITAAENANAPVHQLFYHRLVGGRYAEFYLNKPFELPDGALAWQDLLRRRWVINGRAYPHTLGELIARAERALDPDQPRGASSGMATPTTATSSSRLRACATSIQLSAAGIIPCSISPSRSSTTSSPRGCTIRRRWRRSFRSAIRTTARRSTCSTPTRPRPSASYSTPASASASCCRFART